MGSHNFTVNQYIYIHTLIHTISVGYVGGPVRLFRSHLSASAGTGLVFEGATVPRETLHLTRDQSMY